MAIRRRKVIRTALAAASTVVSPPLPEPEEWRPARNVAWERAYQVRQVQRYEQYEQVVALTEQGLSCQAIATRVGMGESTVRRWLTEGKAAVRRRRKRASAFDPYAASLLKRWVTGNHTGVLLWQEIKALGYRGSQRMV